MLFTLLRVHGTTVNPNIHLNEFAVAFYLLVYPIHNPEQKTSLYTLQMHWTLIAQIVCMLNRILLWQLLLHL